MFSIEMHRKRMAKSKVLVDLGSLFFFAAGLFRQKRTLVVLIYLS